MCQLKRVLTIFTLVLFRLLGSTSEVVIVFPFLGLFVCAIVGSPSQIQ